MSTFAGQQDTRAPYVQASDPGAVGAGVWWIDTSGGTGAWKIKVRDIANAAWEESGHTSGGGGATDPYTSDPGGPQAKLVDPTAGGLSTWINQTSQSVTATITSAAKREVIVAPIHGTQNELRIRKKTLAASINYTATFLLDFRALTNDSHIGGGICLRDGGGQLATMRTDFGNNSLYIEHWASPSGSAAATVDTFGYNQTGLVWMRIIDDGTNRDWLIGDGTNFTRLTRETRTAYLTPTEIGFFANGFSTYLTIVAAQVGLLSFLEA
jgi:hypothetical protein